MDDLYCEESDLYAHGLPQGSLARMARLAGVVSVANDTIDLEGHGFAEGAPVEFRAEADGALPLPLAAGRTYYAYPVGSNRFQVADSFGGLAIDLTTAGSYFVVVSELPVTAAIYAASRLVDDMLPAHLAPLAQPYPGIVRVTTAELAAHKLGLVVGAKGRALTELIDFAQKRLERWAKGQPLRGRDAPQQINRAFSATAAPPDPSGWRTYGGL